LVALLVISLLLLINAAFVLAEYAVVGVGRARASTLAREGGKRAQQLDAVVSTPRRLDRAITACQIGISGSSLALGAGSQLLLTPVLMPILVGWGMVQAAPAFAAGITLTGVTLLQVLFAELVPKALAVRSPERWSLVVILPLRLAEAAFRPLIAVLGAVSDLALRLLGLPVLPGHSLHSPAEIGWLVSFSAREGALPTGLGRRMTDTLRFAALKARDVMVPRVGILAVPETISMAELRQALLESGHTRLPVHGGSLDTITGVIHGKDVLLRAGAAGAQVLPRDLIRPLPMFPWSTPALSLLESMQAERSAMAIILDEHGGTAGLITLEDLLEEVVGEVQDEFDVVEDPIGRLPDGRIRLRADDTLTWVNTRHGMALPPGEARTVGGLIMEKLRRLAVPGDIVETAGWRLKVERVTGRAVATVLAEPIEPAERPGADPGGRPA
jgi:CBS domain containing-hemolysin-like protein